MSAPRWQPNEECVQCNNCDVPFSLFVLRHHCRRCGRIFCDVCTAARVPLLPLHAQPVRVCAGCFQIAFSQIAAAPAAAACVAAASTMPPFANADVESIDVNLLPSILASCNFSLAVAIRMLAGADKFEQAGNALPRQFASLDGTSAVTAGAGSLVIPEVERIAPDGGLTNTQKQLFFERGFVVLRNAVKASLIDAARGLINESLGKGINKKDYHLRLKPDGTPEVDFCPELHQHPVLLNLFAHSGAARLVESVLGVGRLQMPEAAQIALVFPNAYKHAGQHPRTWFNAHTLSEQRAWHIDGVRRHHSDEVNTVWNFSVLFGIYLSDISEFGGNFVCYPGSHRQLESAFREPGGLDALLLDGLPKLRLQEPVQVCARAGDVVLAHYQTAHHVAPNMSPNARYAIYFRLFSTSRERWSWSPDAMQHIWLEFEGMHDIASQNANLAEEHARV